MDEYSDLDLDDLLRELDPDKSPKKSPQKSLKVDNEPDSSTSFKGSSMKRTEYDTEVVKSSKPSGSGKNVRFSTDEQSEEMEQDIFSATKKTSSLLNSMFFESNESKSSITNTSLPTETKKEQSTSGSTSPTLNLKGNSNKRSSDNWLGLDDEDKTTGKHEDFKTSRRLSSLEKESEIGPFGDGNLEFELPWGSEAKSKEKQPLEKKPPIPPSAKKKMGHSASPPRGISPPPTISQKKVSIENDNQHQTSILLSSQYSSATEDFQKTSQSSQKPYSASSILDALPFLRSKQDAVASEESKPKEIVSPVQIRSNSSKLGVSNHVQIGPGDNLDAETGQTVSAAPGSEPNNKATTKASGTKKVRATVKGDHGISTLQLPSHLINEDELKTMCSSLKTLYSNQLELQENSYQEQLDFISSRSARREAMLKEELDKAQENYEERISKLRMQLDESISKSPSNVGKEISQLGEQVEMLVSQLKVVKDTIMKHSYPEHQEPVEIDYDKLSRIVSIELQKNSGLLNIARELENQTRKLDVACAAVKDHDFSSISQIAQRLSEEHKKQTEKIIDNNSSLKDGILKVINQCLSTTFTNFESQQANKLRKTARQIKGIRKDLRLMFGELEGKSEHVHKAQVGLEIEQRNMCQSIRDLNTMLSVTSGTINSNRAALTYESSSTIPQGQSIKSIQTQAQLDQAEMELKLLKEERKNLSETIAQMNVDRRKLNEDKLTFEREKFELEREKEKARALEAESKARLHEALELKNSAEALRQQQLNLKNEVESMTTQINHDKRKTREKFFEMEQTLSAKEQQIYLEKSELMRDKEFLDKLREQMLCPACLATLDRKVPLVPFGRRLLFEGRSSGDGLDVAMASGNLQRQEGLAVPPFVHKNKLGVHTSGFLEEHTKSLKDLSLRLSKELLSSEDAKLDG